MIVNGCAPMRAYPNNRMQQVGTKITSKARLCLHLSKCHSVGITMPRLITILYSCNFHLLLKYLFGICLCSMLISLSHLSILPQNGPFPIFSLLERPFLLSLQR